MRGSGLQQCGTCANQTLTSVPPGQVTVQVPPLLQHVPVGQRTLCVEPQLTQPVPSHLQIWFLLPAGLGAGMRGGLALDVLARATKTLQI